MKFPSEGTLLDEMGYAVDGGVFLVLVGVESCFHIHAEEFAEGLPETGSETAEEGLDDIEGTLVGLAVNQFEQNLALILGHVLHDRLILLEDVFLKVFKVLFTCFLVGDGLDILVCLAKRGKGKFCVWQRLADIADSAPIELLLFFVFEFHRGIDVEIVEYCHTHHITIIIHKPVEASHRFDGELWILLKFGNFRCGHIGTAAEGNGSKQNHQYYPKSFQNKIYASKIQHSKLEQEEGIASKPKQRLDEGVRRVHFIHQAISYISVSCRMQCLHFLQLFDIFFITDAR